MAAQDDKKAGLQAHYQADLGTLSESTRDVLENYSKIPPNEVMPHVYRVRDLAFAIYPYPCIGAGRFLQLALGRHRLYPEILERMRSGNQIYLDLGCAFAQDIRRLVADGVDSKQCYGSDLRLDFIDLGYELFRDKATLQSKFIAADIFDPESALKDLYGKVDVINASSFFHLFGRDDQLRAARQCAKLLKPIKDSLIVGRQRGMLQPSLSSESSGSMFWHSPDSWQEFWTEVGDELGLKFKVDSVLKDESFEDVTGSVQSNEKVSISFSVRRL